MKDIAREIGGYAVVSGVAFACDVVLLTTLVRLAGWHYLLAATAGFCVGSVVAYALSVRFVFRFRRLRSPHAEFVSFATIGAIGLLINAGVMAAGVELLGIHYLLAKVSASGITFGANYIARRLLLFTPPQTVSE
jgi:putative flippase GtrA